MINMFVSYCQKDKIYADHIDLYFKDKSIIIHRDIRDIQDWSSIKEYMNTISKMDYAVLIITENYLKSFNCMYEVLEVMKDNNYKNRIFPVVIETSIYNPKGRMEYVKYWQQQYEELNKEANSIERVNLGSLSNDLRRAQNIASSISEFLGLVSDMNNPDILDLNIAIENKLNECGLLDNETVLSSQDDVFSELNIQRVSSNIEPTDFEKNKFISESFKLLNNLLRKLCNQVEVENTNIQAEIEQINSRTFIYTFYKDGNQRKRLKLFLDNLYGGRENNLGIALDNFSIDRNNSYNAMYSSKFENGQFYLFSVMPISMFGQEITSEKQIVKEIWDSYIFPYLR